MTCLICGGTNIGVGSLVIWSGYFWQRVERRPPVGGLIVSYHSLAPHLLWGDCGGLGVPTVGGIGGLGVPAAGGIGVAINTTAFHSIAHSSI